MCKLVILLVAAMVIAVTRANHPCPDIEFDGCTCERILYDYPYITCDGRHTTSAHAFDVLAALPRNILYGRIELLGFEDMHEVPSLAFDGFKFGNGWITIHDSHHHGKAPLLHDDSFAGTERLEVLILSRLRLTAVPAVIFPSIRDTVETLSLAGNAITILHKGAFAAHGHLLHLDLAENNLKYINPWALTGVPYLHTLDLTSAGIVYLHPGTFRDAWLLETLKLAGNSLVTLQTGVFAGLHHVDHLNFTGSQLVWVARGAFDDTQGIRRVDMPSQTFYWIGEDAFRGLRDVKHIHLTDNHLMTLPRNAFDAHLDNIVVHDHVHVDLTGNPIICDCSIKWMFEHPFSVTGTCSGPDNRIGLLLTDLSSTLLGCWT